MMIEVAFADDGELLNNLIGWGWKVADAQLLQAIGRAYSSAFVCILALAESRPALRQTLKGQSQCGSERRGIALKAAETCPVPCGLTRSLCGAALAPKGTSPKSPHADRIQLANLDVAALQPGPRDTLTWGPTMFMRAVLPSWRFIGSMSSRAVRA
jgi:hypothetical protein